MGQLPHKLLVKIPILGIHPILDGIHPILDGSSYTEGSENRAFNHHPL